MKLCIHTVIYNELDEYLKPWLDYHSTMVDHIFIFEDINSHSHKHLTDKYNNVTLLSVLDVAKDKQRMIDRKLKGEVNQSFYIQDELQWIQDKNEYDWCFAIDIDEFITLQDPYKAIPDVLKDFQENDAVLIQWMNYGASGRVYKPDYNGRDYREFYTERGEQTSNDRGFKITTKIIWNLNKEIIRFIGVHCCPYHWVMTNGIRDRKVVTYEKIYLKHYVTKSWEEYIWKLYKRGMHCFDKHRKDKDFFEINPDMKDRYDELIEIKNNILNV